MRGQSRVLAAALLIASTSVSSSAYANGTKRECKPSGLPSQLAQAGAIEVAQPVDYWSKPWLLITDKLTRPDKVRLLGPDGTVIDIAKPPITVEPVQWLARGRAIYALSKGRSETAGKSDVVLMRWGTDPRPRLTNMRTGVDLEGTMHAAFSNEFLATTWAEKAADGKLHRMASFVDVEDLRAPKAIDLGPDNGAASRVQATDSGFVLVWTSPEGLKRATMSRFGKPSGPTATLAWAGNGNGKGPDASATASVMQCADRTWLMSERGTELTLFSGDSTQSALKELTRLPIATEDKLLPAHCVEDSLVVGRRIVDTKAGNIVFWVSTIDGSGKVRERRVRDIHGGADDIRMPQFSQVGAKLTSWWVAGTGVEAKVWSRELSCE
jgi:hypothetical protein